jgi:hypothetical protein
VAAHHARGEKPTYKRLKKNLTETEREEAGYFKPSAIVKEAWATTLDVRAGFAGEDSFVSMSGEL